MSRSGKSLSEQGFDTLLDRSRKTWTYGEEDNSVAVDKPDFRELDLGSPVSPLRPRNGGVTTAATATTTTSSSSSSGSVSGRSSSAFSPNIYRMSDSNATSNSGELSAESSPKAATIKPGNNRSHSHSHSSGSHHLVYSGLGSVNSLTGNVLPAGNICPSGGILKTGMGSRASKTDILGSGSVNYGHGSIMRGGLASKPSGALSWNHSRGTIVGGESARTMRACNNNDPEELKRMGNDNYKNGNFTEALHLYEKAIALSPGNAAYHYNLAAALIGLKRLNEAVRESEEAIRLDPGYPRAHHRLGTLLLSLGQIENARKHICFPGSQPNPIDVQKLKLVEKHLSKCADARRVGDWRGTLREVDAAIASGADSSPHLCTCRAEAYLKLHKLEDAIFAMPRTQKLEPSNPQSMVFGMFIDAYMFFVSAQIELAQGRFDNALTAIERAGQIDPLNGEISILLDNVRLVGRARSRGNDLFKSERFTEACSAYEEGLRLNPSNSVLYYNRAACWFRLGQWERSVDDCNQALRIRPCYVKALRRRADSNKKLEKWNEAVRDYELLRKEQPDDKEVAELLFDAQAALKKTSQVEDVSNKKFGGEVEHVSCFDRFHAAISSSGPCIVHFETASNAQCKQISPVLNTLCARYPSINFLKVDIEKSPEIAYAENVKIVPTFKIYRKGNQVKEMVCPSSEVLESSVRHYIV